MEHRQSNAQQNDSAGYVFIAAAAALWATAGPISRTLYNLGISPLEVAFWRVAGAAFLFVLRLLISRRNSGAAISYAHFPVFLGFGALGVGAFMVSLAYAFDTGGINLAVILLYSSPAIVALGARFLFKEPVGIERAVLIVLTILGVVLVAVGGGRGMSISVVSLSWGITAAITYSAYYLVGKWAMRRYKPPRILAFVFPVAAISMIPFVRFGTYTPAATLWLLGLSVLCTYTPYLLYYHGLSRVPISRAVVVATIEPVIAALLAATIFGEMYSTLALFGASLVIFAAARASMPVRGLLFRPNRHTRAHRGPR